MCDSWHCRNCGVCLYPPYLSAERERERERDRDRDRDRDRQRGTETDRETERDVCAHTHARTQV